MRNRTWLAALALTGCALVATGCKTNDTAAPAASQSGGTAATTKSVSPTGELIAAAEPLRTTSYKFSITTGGVIAEGAADPAIHAVMMDAAASMKIVVVDGQFYLKFPKGLPGVDAPGAGGDKWLHVDIARLPVGRLGVQDITDPAGGYNYVKTATSVQKTGDRHYKGTLDLTKLAALTVNPKVRSSLGDSAKAVPFEATLDDKGRLSTMDTTMKVNGSDVTSHATFSDYGTRVTVAKPAPSEVTEAPDSVYGLFNA